MTQAHTQTRRPYDVVKRSLDLAGAVDALILLLPLLLFVGLLVRLKLGSPAMFQQQRPGLNGSIFNIWKFRTMRGLIRSRLTAKFRASGEMCCRTERINWKP